MKKKYVVRFSYTNEFECEDDIQALVDAAYAVKYGTSTIRHLELKVVHVILITETPELVELPTAKEEVAPEVIAPIDDKMPF